VKVRTRLFAAFRERCGRTELLLELPEGARVADALAEVRRRCPNIGATLEQAMLAVNHEYVGQELRLHDGDEVALIPPVSGGDARTRRWRARR
jgi:MoaE-MoaD fusion protein